GWGPGRQSSGWAAAEECSTLPKARSVSRAVRATAPKPLAQRSSIWRRDSDSSKDGRPRIGFPSVDEDEFLDVDQDVAEVRPRPGILGIASVPSYLPFQEKARVAP